MTTSTSVPSSLLARERRYCRPCGKDVISRPRVRLAGAGIALLVAFLLVFIGFSALIGPFIMFTAPLILVAGFGLAPLATLASEPPSCPECRRELVYRSRDELRVGVGTERARPLPRAAVGDMKAA